MPTHLYRSVVLRHAAGRVRRRLQCRGLGAVPGGFHSQANGSITANGSTLIGQPWSNLTTTHPSIDPRWFSGTPRRGQPARPAVPRPDVPDVGQFGVLEPRPAVHGPRGRASAAMVALWEKVGIDDPTPDLVTTSASGARSRHHAPVDALVQVPMVARARHLARSVLRAAHHSPDRRQRSWASSERAVRQRPPAQRGAGGVAMTDSTGRGTACGTARIGRLPEVTSIGAAREQTRVDVRGVIRSVDAVSLGGIPTCRCTLADGTGEIDLLFLGRAAVAGLRAPGDAAARSGRPPPATVAPCSGIRGTGWRRRPTRPSACPPEPLAIDTLLARIQP